MVHKFLSFVPLQSLAKLILRGTFLSVKPVNTRAFHRFLCEKDQRHACECNKYICILLHLSRRYTQELSLIAAECI